MNFMAKAKMATQSELGDDAIEGRAGPTHSGELHKMSEHIKEWRGRFFVLHNRKFYYYNTPEEGPSDPSLAGTEGLHKNYIDTTGMTVTTFEETDKQGNWFGLQVEEEFGTRVGGEEEKGQVQRLVTSLKDDRDEWVRLLRFASRPSFVHPDDPRAVVCMESREKFGVMAGMNHCRACGGVFLKVNTTQQPLPELMYDEPVTICRPCESGAKKRSRWIAKVPKEQRSLKKKAAPAAATDAVVGGAKRGFGKLMNKAKSGVASASKAAADITGIEELAVEVKLNLNHCGYLTKLGDIRKNWKRRWFMLDGDGAGILTYYEDEANFGEGGSNQGVNEKGQIDMRHVESVEKDPNGDPERLLLTTIDPESGKQRVWQFRSSTTEDRDMWVAALQAAKDKHNGASLGSKLQAFRGSASPGASEE